MAPTLNQGEYVFVNKIIYLRFDPHQLASMVPFLDTGDSKSGFTFQEPRRGEVVIFEFPDDTSRQFVKRIIGMPGDTIEIKQGHLFVNGMEIEEVYVGYWDRVDESLITVPPDAYYVLGDNRRASNDSRDWGPVPMDNLIGKAWFSFWPTDRWSGF